MDCPVWDRLRRFVNGRLPDKQTPAIEEHLGACHRCMGFVERIGPNIPPKFKIGDKCPVCIWSKGGHQADAGTLQFVPGFQVLKR